jgi:serine/threonine protein kinase
MGFHVGQTFGDYSITALLGAGGMGRVYKVEHCLTKRIEAMKVLTAELATEIQIKRFEREMRVLARLSHPNIAGLHTALHSENQLILLMEFVEGRTLESMLTAGRRLPLDTGIEYIRQILYALRYAHQKGVVHRDVTPANVIVTVAGEVKLTDFGLSKSCGDSLLTCGEILGALPYLAPEQLRGTTEPDQRSDLYSVGAILYEQLTGQKPFGADRRLSAVLDDAEGEPQPPSQLDPSLSPQWDEIMRCALARDPRRRYKSAEEFLDAIAQLESPEAELPLPQLRTLGIGIAIFAVLVLALVVSPAIKRFRSLAPATAPLQPRHIAPPDFAASITPRPVEPTEMRHPKRAAPSEHSAEARVFEPPPAAETSNDEPAASTPVVNEPVVAGSEESSAPQGPSRTKRSFWSRLNVFKRRTGDSTEKQ